MIRYSGRLIRATEKTASGQRQVLVNRVDPLASSASGTTTARSAVGFTPSQAVEGAASTRVAAAPRREARALTGEHMELSYSEAGMGLPASSSVSNVQSPAMLVRLLEGFVPETSQQLNMLYQEIYYNDVVAGSVVDLMSSFPLGDFSLSGLNDERKLRKYAQSVEALKLRTLLPVLSTDYLVIGKFVANMKWDSSANIFTDVFPHIVWGLTTESMPIWGETPVLRIAIPQEVLKIINSGKPEYARFKDRIPPEFLAGGSNSTLLNPADVLYLARPGRAADVDGLSYYRRLIPYWLMYKALIRGTLDQFWRRQRAILHLILSSSDDWKPTESDFRATTELFLSADHDPTGAVVATRDGIGVQEIRRGDDFLKCMDVSDWYERQALRALGMTESIWGMDSSIAVAEGAISMALQFFQGYRNQITRAVFYDKVFPAIAVANRFRKQHRELASSGLPDGTVDMRGYRMKRDEAGGWVAEFAAELPSSSRLHQEDLHRYAMPEVQWHTSLNAQQSLPERLDALQKLSDLGVPIPLRTYAATLGIKLEELAEQRNSDIKIRDFFSEWRKRTLQDQIGPDGQPVQGGADSGGDAAEAASAAMFPGVGSVGRRVGLLNRKFDVERSTPGIEVGAKMKARSRGERDAFNDKTNRNLAEAATRVLEETQKKENEAFNARRKRKIYTPS